MKKIYVSCFLSLVVFFSLNTVDAAVFQRGEVTFKAIGKPSFLKVEGKGSDLTAELKMNEEKLTSGKITFALASLKTGIELRDQHMLEDYLMVKEHPNAILTIDNLDLSKKSTFPAKLKLKNVEKDILVEVKSRKEEKDKTILVTIFSIELTDYNIKIPSYQGITIAKKVDLMIEVELTHE